MSPSIATPSPAMRTAERRPAVALLGAALAIIAGMLAVPVLVESLPPARWLSAVLAPSSPRMDELIFAYAVLPRMAAALVAGAMLGLAGAVFQRVLRNPLVTPDTIGVTSGAQLALAGATLFVPAWLVWREGIALGGGLGIVGLVLALNARSRFVPAALLLTGLAVTLYANAITTVLVLFNAHDLSGLLVWAGGSLAVQDWGPVTTLALWGVALAAVLAMLVQPMALFVLDDAAVRAVGGHATVLRLASLAVAVGLTAAVSGGFGAIGFVSLAAPTFARQTGVRRLGPTLCWSAALGALLLWATDNAAALLSSRIGLNLPTGAVVAILCAPLLVGLAVADRRGAVESLDAPQARRNPRPGLLILALGWTLFLMLVMAVLVGRGLTGWTITLPGADLAAVLPWRAPRAVAAGAAGALLGYAGFLLQRVTGNPMAAPEMLGLSAGAGCGLLLATIAGADPTAQGAAAVTGAVATAVTLMAWVAARRVEPGRVLVTGLALTAAVGSLVSVFGATGDPRALQIMAWMTGSTYRVSAQAAGWASIAAVLAVPTLILATRWLDLMPLGSAARRGLGLPDEKVRSLLILLAAVLAGCGTLIVGPLSFVGLVAPRLAAVVGLHRARAQGFGAMLAGAQLMVLADVIGRTVAFPWQIPSGIAAALLGSPILIILMQRTRSL